MTSGLRACQALRIDAGETRARTDWVAEETPIALLYNGLSFAVMMATPADLEDFALGFAICEGIVATADEFSLVDVVRGEQGIALHAAIPQRRFDALAARTRSMEGRSGCGLCGTAELADAMRPLPALAQGPQVDATRIHAGLQALALAQPLNAQCGGTHAAGFVHEAGVLVREDVGRHNALDKVVGAMLHAEPSFSPAQGFLAITSRASYEIVRKAAHAGIATIAAMSAPTALAIEQAEASGITLIAFARESRLTVYAGQDRISTNRP